jgi:NADPH-dependent F420 reductase
MTIGIIGAGNVGSALARAGTKVGHEVTVTARDQQRAQAVASEVGAKVAPDAEEATRRSDIVILAVPYPAVDEVADRIRDAARGKILIDATNPLKSDLSGLAVSEESGAEHIQAMLPESSVVKAFNTVFASNQAEPSKIGTTLDGFYAGNDEGAKRQVEEFLAALGYRAIDAGDLTAARALEHMAFLNITLNARNGWPWQSGWKLVGPTG